MRLQIPFKAKLDKVHAALKLGLRSHAYGVPPEGVLQHVGLSFATQVTYGLFRLSGLLK